MTQRTCGRVFRGASLGCMIVFWLSGGCAPTRFGPAIAYYAEKTAVTDAAARHTSASPFFRFNTVLISDLNDAIKRSDVAAQREMTAAVLRSANALSLASSGNEIERMPVWARKKLAKRAGVSAAPAVLRHHLSRLAQAALERELEEVNRLTPSELQHKLMNLRFGVEDLPDDRGRAARRILYGWAATLTAKGIAREESHLTERCIAKAEKKLDRIAVWRPAESDRASLITRYAPIIGMEWPANRRYDANFDRIGGVRLWAEGQHIKVRVDAARPTVYAYATVAKIDGRRLRQLNYVWWFAERPKMAPDDPVAGHIDGSMLRITLDANDEPIFIESSLDCGCAHEVFVSERIESAAREAFGAPLTGKRFAVEKSVPGKHDVVVIDTFETGSTPIHPLVLSSAGYHEVLQVHFDVPLRIDSLDLQGEAAYQLVAYDLLDRLPLGDGIASMFGPDGLVHDSGRREGFLLAPSGILSAGQPRKRGTQRIRWDDYLHDDPYLLEKTLRIPPLD